MPSSQPHGSDGSVAHTPPDNPKPLLDIIACDGADISSLVAAAQALEAEVRLFGSPEAWFDHLAKAAADENSVPADVAAMVGGGERVAAQRWIARGVVAAPESRLLAVLVDTTLEQATEVVNQGASGLLVLPNSPDRVVKHLRDVVARAVRCQAERRTRAAKRKAIGRLTSAEHEVLDGMLDGMANKQIAQRLSIGLRTVELRRSKIMKKMQAKSLAQLISFVCQVRTGC